uniref:TBC1 domain family member 2B n=1 Tax=Pan paniscus TaxID=9597 RepID=A0A2R9BJU6_PANPA
MKSFGAFLFHHSFSWAGEKLISISFGDLNPFPLRQIRNRRAYHLEKVRLELTELEAIREDFLRERDTSPDKGELVSDEEEDT